MLTFAYIVLDSKGNPISGKMEQADRSGVINSLIKQGLRPISVRETKKKEVAKTTSGFDRLMGGGGGKVKSDQLVMFTRQLSSMVGAGVPLLRALTALSDNVAKSPTLKRILETIIHDVESGSTLGDALAKHPNTFDDVYVNMVRAGEAAGILDEILKRLAMQQEKSSTMRKKIKSAMAYPMVLMVITILAFFGLMIFIIPQIGKIVTDLGGADAELPALTLAMLAISGFITSYCYIILIITVAIIIGFTRYIKTKKGKYRLHYTILKLPIIKNIVMKIAVAHFARTFSALIEAGVSMLESISVTSRAIGNVIYENSLIQAEIEVKNGKSLSSVIMADPLFPPIVSQMLLVGEETGQTDKVLVKVAEFYEEEVDITIGSLGTIIEPIMIVIMGGMVGLIAASVMLPIAGMAQTIK